MDNCIIVNDRSNRRRSLTLLDFWLSWSIFYRDEYFSGHYLITDLLSVIHLVYFAGTVKVCNVLFLENLVLLPVLNVVKSLLLKYLQEIYHLFHQRLTNARFFGQIVTFVWYVIYHKTRVPKQCTKVHLIPKTRK